MGYKPQPKGETILGRAWAWVQSVNYRVTARWVFYRLLQDGTYNKKAGYKHLLGLLSKARKEFYGPWRPWTLADDTRAPILMQREGHYHLYVRNGGFDSEQEWIKKLKEELNCPLDRWANQPAYVEIWFEAAAMVGQFLEYADENVPLLAFKGDFTIGPKWETAERLAQAWIKYHRPIHIFYFGDYDPKGLIIPDSAWRDILAWSYTIISNKKGYAMAQDYMANAHFDRLGIMDYHIDQLNIPENPERPGTYQWEALDDNQAQALIDEANDHLDPDAFECVMDQETSIVNRFWKTK